MAGIRSKVPSVGSAQWLLSERHQANQLVDLEVEEFGYSVRNELEWLNEHMADVFRHDGVSNVADIFKTPGKLRGKTPRTARKKNPLEARQPLSDIFAPNVQSALSPAKKTQFYKNVAQFKVAEDQENQNPSPAPQSYVSAKPSPIRLIKTVDSGYHGVSEDEVVNDRAPLAAKSFDWSQPAAQSTQETEPETQDSTQIFTQQATQSTQPTQHDMHVFSDGERRTTDESFVSAHEVFENKNAPSQDSSNTGNWKAVDDDLNVMPDQSMMIDEPDANNRAIDDQYSASVETASNSKWSSVLNGTEDNQSQMDLDEVRSPSDGSSPVKPLVRKSSLTFASLPAREPLVTKKSMGNRTSRTSHVEPTKSRGSQMGRFTGGKSLGGSQYVPPVEDHDNHDDHDDHNEDVMDVDVIQRPDLPRFQSETTKIHNKTSTQRLHDRINMLGQSKERDSSKSASQTNPSSQPAYPQLPSEETEKPKAVVPHAPETTTATRDIDMGDATDDDEDWIAPILPVKEPARKSKSQLFKEKLAPILPVSEIDQEARPQLFKSHSADVVEQRYGEVKRKSGLTYDDIKSPTKSPHKVFGMFGHNKSASASSISSPNKPSAGNALGLEKAITVSNPVDLSTVLETNTPPGSPTGKKFPDGPVSASKSKLYAAIRAAKEKFIGSSAASAQAKLDALNQSPQRQLAPKASFESIFSPKKRTQPGQLDDRPVSRDSKDEGRRTRSSTEREEKRKEQETREAMDKQRADESLEKIREKERQKAATQFQKAKATAKEPQPALPRPGTAGKVDGTAAEDERPTSSHRMPPPAAPKSNLPTGGQKLREPKRLLKAASKDTLPKAKPPVIRVNLTGSRFGQPAAQAAQAQPKQPEIANKASAETLNRSASSSHPPPRMNRALMAAANKKKEEERKAAEKEQKRRELEQKRAQKAEDEKIEKERKAAEQRELVFKKARAAQKAAADEKERAEKELTEQKAARLADQERTKATLKAIAEAKQKHQERLERQERQQAERQQAERQQAERQQAARPASRPGPNNLTNALQQEKAQAQPHPRADLGAAKSVSRMQTIQDQSRPVPPINPAKPPKRIFRPEDDEPVQRPAIQRAGPSYQQQDGKRRKTVDEEDEYEQQMPSVKAPPIRHSNMRKDAANRFPSGYMQAPQQTSTMLKTATGHAYSQQQMKSSQTGEMARFANGKIPFAEAPNPPANTNHYGQNYKTPVRGMLAPAPSTTKSSPSSFNPGNEIELPDCFTDSEDDDDDNGFVRPDWANTPQLQELLKAQQLIDPETIFGPIQPLNMEKIFKDHPERHEKFRKRTSSARWTNDEITTSEKKRDREARERLFRDGHWTYHPSPAPTLNKRN